MSNYGLRGHETVIRLVGKRRKLTLSAISSEKSAPNAVKEEVHSTSLVTSGDTDAGLDVKFQSSSSNSIPHNEEGLVLPTTLAASSPAPEQGSGNKEQDDFGTQKQLAFINWVQCPICGKSVRPDVINIHIDACLQGGTKDIKRKSKQLTMPQFSGSTCLDKLSSPYLPAGLRKFAGEGNPSSVSVKLESSVLIGPPEPTSLGSQGRGNRMDEKPNDKGRVKLEDRGPVGPSQSVVVSSLGHDFRQTRMRLKCLATKDAPAKPDLCPKKKEEPGLVVECGSPVVFLARSMEEAPGQVKSGTSSEEMALDTQECGKNGRHGNDIPESTSFCQLLDRCSCHCHLLALNVESMSNGSGCKVTVDSQVVGGEQRCSSGLNGAVEKFDFADKVETGTGESTNVHSTEKRTNDTLLEVLRTKIVGRRFHRGTICQQGMKVTISREPDNPKDPNAIKVVQLESPNGLALGHLAKEISLHLSSLLDKGLLQVWGTVTAIPEHTFGAVPIKLFCESKMSKEDFLKLDGTEDSLRNVMVAAENPDTPERTSSESVSKYQHNFLFMLQTVLERDSHLFKDDEKTFLGTFSSLSDDAQRLFIRLYQRKGPWFRLSTVQYKDVANVVQAADELLAAGFMTAQGCPDEDSEKGLRKRFEILNVTELQQFVCSTLMKKKSEAAAAKKDDLVKMAVSASFQKHVNLIPESPRQSGSALLQMLAGITGKCIRVSETAEFLLWRLKRLFFLNGDTEFSAFLVVDMGLVKYPHYKCWRARNIFETRQALLAYEQALEIAQGMDMALECNDMKTALKLLETARQQMHFDDSNQPPAAKTPTFLARFSASYVYRNVCTLGVSILERERRYSEAVSVLKQLLSSKTIKSGRWGYWTLRLSMDLDHLGQKEESLQVAEAGVGDPWIRGGDLVALQRRVVRLGKPPRRWKTPPFAAALKRNCKEVQIQGRPLNCVTGVKSWFYGYDGQQCRVEELALQYYASEEGGGWMGVHCEGGVWMTFFGLLMWDILFADVPDVFQTSFQTAPLDLDTEVFFSSRQSIIEAQLTAISEGDIAKLLARTWNQNMGTMCQGVSWERHSLEELQTIASCIGGPGLSAVCRLLAEDHAGWTAGMPDLLLWRTPTSDDSDHPSQVSTDSMLCTKCGCNLLRKAFVGSKGQGKCTTECSLQGEEQVGKGDDEFRQSFDIRRTFTSRMVSNHGEAKLVEVKGPRDRLSEQQRAWIWILMNAGLSVEVCKVLEQPIE